MDFMETKGGREIANYALDRATQVFLKVCSNSRSEVSLFM